MIDGHLHVPSSKFIPEKFIKGIAKGLKLKMMRKGMAVSEDTLTRTYQTKIRDHECDALVGMMDAAEISEAVMLLPDFTFALGLENLALLETMYQAHVAIKVKHPNRFFLFAGVDPRWGTAGLRLFEKWAASGELDGVKLYPPCGYSPSCPSLSPFYEIAASHNFPVLLHTGPTSAWLSFEYSQPNLIDRAARNFPTLNFILAHGGVNYIEQSVLMCAYRPNVYLDFSGYSAEPCFAQKMQTLLGSGVTDKIIFGTDWPLSIGKSGYVRVVASIAGKDGLLSRIPKADRNLILQDNMRFLLDSSSSSL